MGIAPALFRQDEGRLRCTFLSVGHGSATVLELPSGQTMLYDAGQLGSPAIGTRSVSSPRKKACTRALEVIVSRPVTNVFAITILFLSRRTSV